MTQINHDLPSNLEELYAGSDLVKLFPGGFINFGYYDGIDIENIDQEKRILSQKNLYTQVFNSLHIHNEDCILEVGIGYGGGPAWAAENFQLKKMIGIDIFDRHVKLAEHNFQNHLKKYACLSYRQSVAENILFEDASFNKIYTIEAFQHFTDQRKFLAESFRLLKKDGVLVIATFFLTAPRFLNDIGQVLPKIAVLPSVANEQDIIMTVDHLLDALKTLGFDAITIAPIGSSVWRGYNNWVAQTENNWDLGWLKSYEAGMLDYYIVQATRK